MKPLTKKKFEAIITGAIERLEKNTDITIYSAIKNSCYENGISMNASIIDDDIMYVFDGMLYYSQTNHVEQLRTTLAIYLAQSLAFGSWKQFKVKNVLDVKAIVAVPIDGIDSDFLAMADHGEPLDDSIIHDREGSDMSRDFDYSSDGCDYYDW